MGASASSLLEIQDLEEEFENRRSVTAEEYFNHSTNRVKPGDIKLTSVPPELCNKVRLLRSVDLSFNNIVEIPAGLPLTLPHLQHLDISHNQLTTLPDSVFGFIHLQSLDLSYNHISSLPQSFTSLHQLNKLDLSHNLLSTLPVDIDCLNNLEKINLSHNLLDHLPISLGNLDNLRVLLVGRNKFTPEFRVLSETGGSEKLILHLRSCFLKSQEGDLPSQCNIFRRERGPVFDSKILNSGSAQSFFNQIQTQAVNTGNRLLTPLIPPPQATTLDSEAIKDKLLGMFYGSVVGDCMGVFTQSFTPTQAEFHYQRESFIKNRLYVDEYRCHFSRGGVTLASQVVGGVLDSVMGWGGVVDELDYAKKLHDLIKSYGKPLTSPVMQGLAAKSNFIVDPTAAAREWMEQTDTATEQVVCDSFCLPPMVGLVVSQFHDLREIERNAARICKSTHAAPDNVMAAILLAQCLAKLIQGLPLDTALEEIETKLTGFKPGDEEKNNNIIQMSHPLTTLKHLTECVSVYKNKGFKAAVIVNLFKGGEASVGSLVVGAVLGLDTGYANLPSDWLEVIDPDFRLILDRRLNTLFDMMGIP